LTRYWVLTPYDSRRAEAFEKAWKYDLDHGTIAIGWNRLGDISALKKNELKDRMREVYGNENLQQNVNSLWTFYHEISPGDIVVARKGTKKIIGIGTVTGPAYFDENQAKQRLGGVKDRYYPNFIPVRWEEKHIAFDNVVFSREPVYELPKERYERLIKHAETQQFSWRQNAKRFSYASFEKFYSLYANFAGDRKNPSRVDEVAKRHAQSEKFWSMMEKSGLRDLEPDRYTDEHIKKAFEIFDLICRFSYSPTYLPHLSFFGGEYFYKFRGSKPKKEIIERHPSQHVRANIKRMVDLVYASKDEIASAYSDFCSIQEVKTNIATALLALSNPKSYPMVNNKTVSGLRVLGIAVRLPRISYSEYMSVVEVLKNLMEISRRMPDGGFADFLDLDYFLHLVATNVLQTPHAVFKGFSDATFDFLNGMRKSIQLGKPRQYLEANRAIYEEHVRGPLEILMAQVAKDMSDVVTDLGLETSRNILSRISPRGSYKDYVWAAFYRKERKNKSKDVQFFVTVTPENVRIGLYFGDDANELEEDFKNRVARDPRSLMSLIRGMSAEYSMATEAPDHLVSTRISLETEDQTREWVQSARHIHILRIVKREDVISKGPDLSALVCRTFRELLPLYRFCIGQAIQPETPRLRLKPVDIDTNLVIPDEVKDQICSALNAGKHVIISGPPGTGKTTLAEDVCKAAVNRSFCDDYLLTTATSDWTTFDTIGGYLPDHRTEGFKLRFEEGLFLRAIRENKWLVIDEINRADIDKAFGQVFTVLSGQRVILPFRDTEGHPVTINKDPETNRSLLRENEYVVGNNWRIIATMNVYDKHFLYNMSYAFMRRFAFIYLDSPSKDDIREILDERFGGRLREETIEQLVLIGTMRERAIGPAILFDIGDYVAERGDTEVSLAEAIIAYLIPQLEGLEKDKVEKIFTDIAHSFSEKTAEELRRIFQEVLGIEVRKIRRDQP